jgi:hypothetical protein
MGLAASIYSGAALLRHPVCELSSPRLYMTFC